MQNVDITINRDANALSSGSAPVLYIGNLILMRCTLVDADGSAIVLPADNQYYASLDTTYGPSHTDLVTVADSLFNDTDDWADADPTAGKICFQLTTATQAIITAMSTDPRKKVHLEIWTKPTGGDWEMVLHEDVILYNITADFTPTSSEGTTYLTTDDLDDVVAVSDEGYTVAAPASDLKTLDPSTATFDQVADFVATLARTLNSKGAI